MSREADVQRVLEWLIGTCYRVKALLESGQELDPEELNAVMDSAISVAERISQAGIK